MSRRKTKLTDSQDRGDDRNEDTGRARYFSRKTMEWGVRVDARKHVLVFKGEAWGRQNSKMTPMTLAVAESPP